MPLPRIRSPVDVIGDNALNAAVAVICPVPPELIPKVPASVTAPVVATLGVNPFKDVLNDKTPVLVTVISPVGLDTIIPVPAINYVTPVFVTVILPEPLVIPIAVPAVNVFKE